jgi:thiol-disulfide isomerase/thioredoxin
MSAPNAVALLVALLVASALGLGLRARSGRLRQVGGGGSASSTGTDLPWPALGIDPGSARVTAVQFSAAVCAPCRTTSRLLTRMAAELPDVRHVEVAAEQHLDVVQALGIASTPTTLLIDRRGSITGRMLGVPRAAEIRTALTDGGLRSGGRS